MIKFSNPFRYEPDNWNKNGSIFTTEENLNVLREAVEKGNFIVAEHWHYRGSRAPDRMMIEDFDDFIEYLENKAIAGDIIDVFDITEIWDKKKSLVSGKLPDENGDIPEKGAY